MDAITAIRASGADDISARTGHIVICHQYADTDTHVLALILSTAIIIGDARVLTLEEE